MKPIPKYPIQKILNYHDAIKYIEGKYKIVVRDYHKTYKGELEQDQKNLSGTGHTHLDFWHWLIDRNNNDVHNEGKVYIPCPMKGYPKWINEILTLIYTEFYPEFYKECVERNFEMDDGKYMWVEW